MEAAAIAEALFNAFAAKDDGAARALCAPALSARQNNGAPMSLDTLLSFSGAVHRVVKDFRYADPVRSATATGFVEEHFVQGTLPNGKALNLAACVVATVRDGKITELREYFDTGAAADLIAALSK